MKLVIKGHPTRGGEVIQLLEMLGGKNIHNYVGTTNEYYAIDNNKICTIYTSVAKIDNCVIFTLEDFEEKFPYKVGDKVTLDKSPCIITGMSWYCDDVIYYVKGVDFSKGVCSTDLQPYEEETNMKNDCKKCGLHYSSARCFDMDYCPNHKPKSNAVGLKDGKVTDKNNCDINCPDGYEFYDDNGNLIGDKIIMRPKKSQYPKSYKECEASGFSSNPVIVAQSQGVHMRSFAKLIVLRNAYWEIAGKQLGLDKPWEPDWDNLSTTHEFIKIYKGCFIYSSRVLVFPTAEMRDAFYDNFKNLIEQCKELL